MTTWVLGLRGVGPIKNSGRSNSKRRNNPGLTNEDRSEIKEWAKMRRRNPSRRNPVDLDWARGDRSGTFTDKTARSLKEKNFKGATAFEKELYGEWESAQPKGEQKMASIREDRLNSPKSWKALGFSQPDEDFSDWLGPVGASGDISGPGLRSWRGKPRKKAKARAVPRKKLLREAGLRGIVCRSYMTNKEISAKIKRFDKKNAGWMRPGPDYKMPRAAWGKCQKKRKGLSYEQLKKEAKKAKVSLSFKAGKNKGKRKTKAQLQKSISSKRTRAGARRRNPMSRMRRNPWWKGLLGGDASEDYQTLSNPRRRRNMANSSKRRVSVKFLGAKRRRRRRRRKNPLDINQDIFGGVSIKDLGIATAAVAGLNVLENGFSKYVGLDLSGFGRLGTAASKLGIGIGGAYVAEQAGVLRKNSELDKMIKLAAVFGAVQDIAQGLVEQLSGAAEAFGLGELISHPASQGSVSLTELGELSYNPYALGMAVGPDGQSLGQTYDDPRFGEAITYGTPSNATVALTNQLGYTSDQYGDPMASLGGGFYAGNVGLPKGAAQHPDFMNMVPGRSDLSAVPDFMR